MWQHPDFVGFFHTFTPLRSVELRLELSKEWQGVRVWQYPDFLRLFHTSTTSEKCRTLQRMTRSSWVENKCDNILNLSDFSTLWSVELSKAWFTPYFLCAEPNVNWISSTWSDTGAISDSDGVPSVEPKLSSTNVRQTLSNLTLLAHQTKIALPNWFRRRFFSVPRVIHQLASVHEWSGVCLNRALAGYFHTSTPRRSEELRMKNENRDLVASAGHLCDLANKLTMILNSTYTYGTSVAKPTCMPVKARKPTAISLLSHHSFFATNLAYREKDLKWSMFISAK